MNTGQKWVKFKRNRYGWIKGSRCGWIKVSLAELNLSAAEKRGSRRVGGYEHSIVN